MVLDGDFGPIDDSLKNALTHSYDSTKRLIELVNDVLSVSKIESGNMSYYMENFEAASIMTAVYKDIRIEAQKKNITLKLDIDPLSE